MDSVLVDRPRDGVAVVTLNRPEKLNALDYGMFERLHGLWVELEAAQDVRAIVLTGAGRGFCAGHDLNDMKRMETATTPNRLEILERDVAALTTLRSLSKPVVAAINGAAMGGGLSLATLADVRITSTTASFGVAFIEIGLSSADAGLSWTLPRIVGLGAASELMLTGRTIDATEALAIGLVNRVVEPDDLLAEALDIAARIADHAPLALRLTKEALNQSASTSFEDACSLENRTQLLALASPGARGQDRFLTAGSRPL